MVLQRFLDLCDERNEYPTKVATIAGYDKSILTSWKKVASENDGICNVSSSRLRTIAEHLGTTSDYLLGITNEKKPFSVSDIIDNPRKMLLLDESDGMTDKSLEQIIRMMRVIKGMQDE
jgi:hypothetical protein